MANLVQQHVSSTLQDVIQTRNVTYQCDAFTGNEELKNFDTGRDPNHGYFVGSQLESGSQSIGFDTLKITFQDLKPDNLPVLRFQKKSITSAVALEKNPNYLTWWNYHIIKKTGTSETIDDSIWKTETQLRIPQPLKVDHKWLKYGQKIDAGWEVHLQCDKPGVTSYIVPTTTVLETGYYKDQQAAIDASSATGFLEVPQQTFGLPGDVISDVDKWLVMSANLKQQNDWYITETVFQFLEGGWDTDIYSEG